MLKLEKYISDPELKYSIGIFMELEKGEGLSKFNLMFFEKDKVSEEIECYYK